MFRIVTLSLILCFSVMSNAQKPDLFYYLGEGHQFNRTITTPAQYFGFEIGEFHLSTEQIYAYMRHLSDQSNRAVLIEHGRSYEERPLYILAISDSDDPEDLERKRLLHRQWAMGEDVNQPIDEIPIVLYQGYTVHGNEASGANAAVLYAYYLTACKDKDLTEMLDKTVILLDPVFNPDGMNRFATWVNSNKNINAETPNNYDREYDETWPGGRTNHYWFDLNRDWLPVQHPESQGRLKMFHAWKPNILTDHHEMGGHRTFFFQPGIPSRTNPLTPKENQMLTASIADYHAAALDDLGSLYYSKESFDDFYYGKGSTYPDANGCIGILFEQASARGHRQNTPNGVLKFPFAIKNQLTTSISTLQAGWGLKNELLDYQRKFHKDAISQGGKEGNLGYLVGSDGDAYRFDQFKNLLNKHQIQFEENIQSGSVDDEIKGPSVFIPFRQAQFKLIRGLFQAETSFQDSLFYDVSSWTMPVAFGLPYREIGSSQYQKFQSSGEKLGLKTKYEVEEGYAWAIPWDQYQSPALVYELLERGFRLKVATKPFSVNTITGKQSFERGTVVLNSQGQDIEVRSLREVSEHYEIPIIALKSGLAIDGIDLGSPGMEDIELPQVGMVVGDGIRAYDAGEIWHLLEYRVGIPVVKLETNDINRRSLATINTLIFPNGAYGRINKSGQEALQDWISDGGTLILQGRSMDWAAGNDIPTASRKATSSSSTNSTLRSYDKLDADRGAQVVGGCIVNAKFDPTHPLFYGINGETIRLFKRGTTCYQISKNPYATPMIYDSNILASGYMSEQNQRNMRNTAALTVTRQGSGRIINMVDNYNFRAFWYGTNKIFLNAVFLGKTIKSQAAD